MVTMKNTSEFEALSIEAKVVCGGFWGIIRKNEVSFARPWVIHPRMRKGLDELVDAGYLTVKKPNNISDTLVWRYTDKLLEEKPRVSMGFIEANNFPSTTE